MAKTLADRFGILISAEDPDQRSPADLTDRTDKAPAAWKAAHPETRVYDLKRWRLEIRFLAPEHETLHDVPAVLQQVADAANVLSPYGYRLDRNGEFAALVPTRTRNEAGEIVERVALLDRHITIPVGARRIADVGNMLAKQLSEQAGLRVACCQMYVAGIPWGMAEVSFEARDEPARKVLERLIRLEEQSTNPSSIYYWFLTCDSQYCFIEVQRRFSGRCGR
ncbi:MAG: hypothetical protein LAN64_11225 [Acidobacteriia bacterium]|nr:hypothetical protein [Terriglobia bacterium]